MKRDIKTYLEDIRLSVNDIESYISTAKSVSDIENNRMLFDALCRRFAIIGEAVYQANKLDHLLPITDKQKIAGLRHIIVHDYDTIDATKLWVYINRNLPVLKTEIGKLLEELP